MPSLGQNGGAMNDSFAQQFAQTPSPATGSRQATHSVGSAISSASRAAWRHAPRQALSAPRKWVEMERVGDASASMGARLAPWLLLLKRQGTEFSPALCAKRSNPEPQERLDCFVASLLAMTMSATGRTKSP